MEKINKKKILYLLSIGGIAGVITSFWGTKYLLPYLVGLFLSVVYKNISK